MPNMLTRYIALILGVCSLTLIMALTAINTNTLSLVLTSTAAPAGIAGYVNPSFAGFGIESSNLFSFTGMDQPNRLTFNLIDNLAKYTGRPPHIRIGGNTADYMVFDQSQNEWAWVLNKFPKGQGTFPPNHMVIGPRFFEAVNRFPPATPLTWGLNGAYAEPDWADQITTMAQEVLSRVKHLNLLSFELGNEPDLWLQNGFRSGGFGGRKYVEEWLERATVVWEKVLKPNNIPSNFFEVGCTASTIGTDFQIADLMTFGPNIKATGSDASYIAAWNQHDYYYFIGVSAYPITLEYLMRLSTTEEQFAAWEGQVQQSKKTPFPYVVREMGIVGPMGLDGISDVFGGAFWTFNFLLYTASLDIASIQFHMTDNSNASAWQPVTVYDREPFVRPLYYGMAAFDQTIGNACSAQVSRSKIASYPLGYRDFIRAYNVYQGGELDSIVVLNGKPANVSDSNKASIDFSLKLPASLAGQKLHLAYLTSEGADAINGTIWNGMSYEKSGDGTPTIVSDEDKTVEVGANGNVTFSVRDSEAVVATIGRKLGEGLSPPDQAKCTPKAFKPITLPKGGNGHDGSGPSASTKGDDDGSAAAAALHEYPRVQFLACVIALGAALFSVFGLLY